MDLVKLIDRVLEIRLPGLVAPNSADCSIVGFMCDKLTDGAILNGACMDTPVYRYLTGPSGARMSVHDVGQMLAAMCLEEDNDGYKLAVACCIAIAECEDLPKNIRDKCASMVATYQRCGAVKAW